MEVAAVVKDVILLRVGLIRGFATCLQGSTASWRRIRRRSMSCSTYPVLSFQQTAVPSFTLQSAAEDGGGYSGRASCLVIAFCVCLYLVAKVD